MQSHSRPFSSKFRTVFWPIYKDELGKFIPMSALMFCILFNQNILRILKDSILISEVSAEVPSFAKVYCVTPAATLFVILYAKSVNHFSFQRIFYFLTAFFVSFYIIFAFLIYPNVDVFHMASHKIDKAMVAYPHFKWYIAMAGHWSYIVFYTLSELWPNIFYVLLFWQFANSITTTGEAKRFYTLFSLFGNSSLIFVGLLLMNLSSERTLARHFFDISNNKIILVQLSTVFMTVSAFLSCMIIRFITKNVLTDPALFNQAKAPRETREKMGVIKSFQYIARSKYLWLMLICSAAYGLSINLVEAVWKAKIKQLYPTVNSFAEFSSLYILWTGVTIMVMTIIGNNIMRSHGWFVTAVISPIIIMITGILFFTMVIFDHQILSLFDQTILMTPLAIAVFIGTIQNILAKGTKYSIWDTSREMLYIPLDNELKTKGKAAVDIISSKVGKSSSGLLQSLLFVMMPAATMHSISPILMTVFTIVCVIWIYAIKKINFEYQKIA